MLLFDPFWPNALTKMRLLQCFPELLSLLPLFLLHLIQVIYRDKLYVSKRFSIVYRQLYSATVETFPAAFLLLAAAVSLLSSIANFYVYTQRHRLRQKHEDKKITEPTESKQCYLNYCYCLCYCF